jgi:murein DD-endopeptidase MepM/ murein hydrolase activator NlpD
MKNFSNLRLSKALAILFVATPFISQGQFSKPEEKFSSEEQYLYPIQPGQPGSLAGTMGELRSTHFHSGIDIRTDNKVGFPVQASKSGYISRISVTGSGYGNVMYVTHPDGNTTLYAHLEKFLGPAGDYVLQEHYRRQANELDLYFREDQFRVSRGDTIAISGNTGSTNGPHLHFDIRDSLNFALDPIKVAGFPELVDRLPPAAEKIALRTLDINSRINDQFGRFEFYAQRVGTSYVLPNPIMASGNIGVELVAKDKLAPQSQFYGGVNYFEMRVDSQVVFRQGIERVNVAETRAIYTVMDYKTMRNKGTKFYKLYIEDGNDLKFYDRSPGTGRIQVRPSAESSVQINMKDSDGNASTVSFRLTPSAPVKEVKSLAAYTSSKPDVDILENTMIVTSRGCGDSDNKAKLYSASIPVDMDAAYFNHGRAVYLIDLRTVIPDSIVTCSGAHTTRIVATVPSETDYTFYGDQIELKFPLKALYDTLYLTTNHYLGSGGNEIFGLGSRDVPLHQNIRVSLVPQKSYGQDKNYAVYRVAGKSYYYVGGSWINGRIQFDTREFGEYTILRDSVPPSITLLSLNSQRARFRVRDFLSGIATIEARINGEWLLMNYDAKSSTIWSEKLDPASTLNGDFQLLVTDQAGNVAVFSRKI